MTVESHRVTAILEPFGGMGWYRVTKVFIYDQTVEEALIAHLGELDGLRQLKVKSTDEALFTKLRKALPQASVASWAVE